MFFNDLKEFTKHFDVRTAMDRGKIISLLQTTRAYSKVHISSEGIIQHSNTNQNQVQRSSLYLIQSESGSKSPGITRVLGCYEPISNKKINKNYWARNTFISGSPMDRQWIAGSPWIAVGSPGSYFSPYATGNEIVSHSNRNLRYIIRNGCEDQESL